MDKIQKHVKEHSFIENLSTDHTFISLILSRGMLYY